ncbi:MAG: ABC transporter ATP-binding protein [Chitinophagaceae bacterium]
MPAIIQVENLTKNFKEIHAVDALSFSVHSGEVFGFLGQNGAGKSTTIRMLLTLIAPTSGQIRIFNKPLHQHRREILKKVGAIIEKPDLYNYLTAIENLMMMARLSGLHLSKKELLQHLETVGIKERAESKVKTFSQGMKQRLGIACALVHNPDLIILDEPTNGLDPQGIADVRNLILHLSRNEGKTVLVSSHLLSEIEVVADSMLIIDKGKKVAAGRVSELLNPADTVVEIQTTGDKAAMEKLQNTSYIHQEHTNGRILIRLHQKEIPDLIKFLTEQGVGIMAVQQKHTLEDYFLSLTTANQHVAAYQD